MASMPRRSFSLGQVRSACKLVLPFLPKRKEPPPHAADITFLPAKPSATWTDLERAVQRPNARRQGPHERLIAQFELRIATSASVERIVVPVNIDTSGKLFRAGIDVVALKDDRVVAGTTDLGQSPVTCRQDAALVLDLFDQVAVAWPGSAIAVP